MTALRRPDPRYEARSYDSDASSLTLASDPTRRQGETARIPPREAAVVAFSHPPGDRTLVLHDAHSDRRPETWTAPSSRTSLLCTSHMPTSDKNDRFANHITIRTLSPSSPNLRRRSGVHQDDIDVIDVNPEQPRRLRRPTFTIGLFGLINSTYSFIDSPERFNWRRPASPQRQSSAKTWNLTTVTIAVQPADLHTETVTSDGCREAPWPDRAEHEAWRVSRGRSRATATAPRAGLHSQAERSASGGLDLRETLTVRHRAASSRGGRRQAEVRPLRAPATRAISAPRQLG